jgi:hypothetical protein
MPRLVLELEDGSSAPVLEIAQRVADHWRKSMA